VRYSAQAPGANFSFTRSGAVLALTKGKKGLALRLAFLGVDPSPDIEGAQRLPGRVNYLIGNDPARWHTNLPTYGEVGVVGGRRVPVDSRFALGARSAYGFAVGSYDTALPLVIDPGLAYSTFLGGSSDERGSTYLGSSARDIDVGIAIDEGGNAYVTEETGLVGSTAPTDFPTTPGAFDPTFNGGLFDGFVTKLNSTRTGLVYSTFLGGSARDDGFGIVVDSGGSAYVTGTPLRPISRRRSGPSTPRTTATRTPS
jgi:hypothetical protein